MKTCTIDGCDSKHLARGLCSTHYNRAHQPNRHAKVKQLCHVCGSAVVKHRPSGNRRTTCSDACRRTLLLGRPRKPKPPVEPKAPTDRRGPLRRAVEVGDHVAVIAAVRSDCNVTDLGCWEWKRSIKRGYAVVTVGGRTMFVHRLVLEAKLGAPLGKQAAHHKCANTLCVNPQHLQPITARENVAEMLARAYLESRVRDLEAALAAVDPNHPLLREAGISPAA